MANTEIDSLSLEIKVNGLNSDDIKNLDKLSKAVSRLTKSLKEADFSKLKDIQVPKGLKNIQIITQNFKDMSSTPVSSAVSDIQTSVEDLGGAVSETTTEVSDDLLKIEQGASNVLPNVRREIKATKDEINDDKKESFFSKSLGKIGGILKRIKLIAFIKAVRATLNAVVQAVQAGVTNLASFDGAFNETMSNIKTATTTMANSLALIFRPFIEVLEPFITSMSQSLASIGNEVSRLQAVMKGTSTYTKINAKYMEDFSKSSQKATLFSFDTFNTLKTDDKSDMYETASVEKSEDTEKEETRLKFLEQIQNLLQNVMSVISTIVGEVRNLFEYLMPVLTPILAIVNRIIGTVSKFLSTVLQALNPLIEVIMGSILGPLLEIIDAVLEPIFVLLDSLITPVIGEIVTMVVNVLHPILKAIKPILQPIESILRTIGEMVGRMSEALLPALVTIIKSMETALKPIVTAIEYVFNTIADVLEIFDALFHLDFKAFGEKIVKFFKNIFMGLVRFLASILDSIVNGIIEGLNVIFTPLNAISDFFDWGWNIGIDWRLDLASKVPTYANGGIVGELWQMNEYGNAEMLYNSNNSGDTSVINQAQLSLAFEQAIYNTGLLDLIEKAGIINIDGRDIAQSSNFKRELNRTNPGLNLR